MMNLKRNVDVTYRLEVTNTDGKLTMADLDLGDVRRLVERAAEDLTEQNISIRLASFRGRNQELSFLQTVSSREQAAMALCFLGSKIAAIKIFRATRNLGLKEAKDLVESIERGGNTMISSRLAEVWIENKKQPFAVATAGPPALLEDEDGNEIPF